MKTPPNPRPGIMSLPKPKKAVAGNVERLRDAWENEPTDISRYLGFVYRITNKTTGRFYIGKKLFWRSRGKARNRKMFEESDWRKYFGSSKELVADVREFGRDNFRREIIALGNTKSELAVTELMHQLHECFGEVPTYNGIINLRLRFNEPVIQAVKRFLKKDVDAPETLR